MLVLPLLLLLLPPLLLLLLPLGPNSHLGDLLCERTLVSNNGGGGPHRGDPLSRPAGTRTAGMRGAQKP